MVASLTLHQYDMHLNCHVSACRILPTTACCRCEWETALYDTCALITLLWNRIYIYIALSSYTKGHKHVQELQKYMHNCSKHAVETSRCGYQLAAIPPDSLIMSNRVSRVKPKSLHLEHKITTWKQHDWKNGKTNNKKQCVTFPFQQLARLLYMTRKHSFAHTSKVLRRQPETNFQHFRCCITRC
jgi:hypothetical protein